jgi:hypothetical protein
MRHHQLRSAGEQSQEFVNQTALSVFAGNHRLKNIRVADFLNAAKSFLTFQTAHDRLNGRVGRSPLPWKSLLDLSNGTRTLLPEPLEHLQFQLRKFWPARISGLQSQSVYYNDSQTASLDFIHARPSELLWTVV